MAPFSALLRRGATTYPLTAGSSFAFPNLEADISIVGGTGAAAPRLVSESMGTPTMLTVPIMIQEASQALMRAEVDAIDAYLRLGECTLEVTFTDAAAATIWTVYHAQPVQPPFTPSADLAHWVEASLTLVVSPFVTPASVTLHNAVAVTAPSSLDLSAMTGNYKSPLNIEYAATPTDVHSLYLAMDPTSLNAYLSDGKDLTWGAGETDTADAAARTGSAAYVRSLTPVAASIETSTYPEGPYLILARVKVKNGKTGYVTTDKTVDVISFTRATFHIVELGRCYLPSRKVRGGGSAPLVVSAYGSSASAGDECCVDWVYPLPIGNGVFSYHPDTATVDATSIGRDADSGITYVDNVANEQDVEGGTLMALGGTLLIVAESAAGTDPTHAANVTVTYEPRFGWMR